jgi:sialate O-acetylesterase
MILPALIQQIQLPFIAPCFSSHMVLQRDKPNAIWGWSTPGSEVRVSISGNSATATADATGKWLAKIKPPKAGGPYKLTVEGLHRVELDDILVGDVWICSGQSNMEMGIGMAKDAQKEIAAATDSQIRLFMGTKVTALKPADINQGAWAVCSPENVAKGGWGGFSAVGYYFGKHLRAKVGVPIGLIQTAWGGSAAEAWTSASGIASVKDFDNQVAQAQNQSSGSATSTNDLIEQWVTKNSPMPAGAGNKKVKLPGSTRQMGFDGKRRVYWFHRTLNLSKEQTGQPWLTVGSIEGADALYVNGKRVMAGNSILIWQAAQMPAGVLKEGENDLWFRLVDLNGNGGVTNPQFNMDFGNGKRVELGGEWEVYPGTELDKLPKFPPLVEGNPNWPTVLHNAMLKPFQPMAIKGALWYQGETNVGRGEQYSRLLPALITDWRKGFDQGDFPFLVVQLANYGRKHAEPTDNGWAELQEAQAIAVTRVKNAALATTLDIGMGNDIHPTNKQDVGYRLGLQAERIAYGRKLVSSGPTYKGLELKGNQVIVKFDNLGGGLVAKGSLDKAFAILGSTGKWTWADAKIVGNTIVLSAKGVVAPMYVRYAWDEDPNAPLYNKEGLPAVPFRVEPVKQS